MKATPHSDGARSYKMRATGVAHENAAHREKRKKIRGKRARLKPIYSKVATHKLPDGSTIK
eukprot:8335830-Pyramimonas_sp.AAC.1